MNLKIAGLCVISTIIFSGAAPAVGQGGIQKLLPGTSYTVAPDGSYYVSTNIDEMWPGVWKVSTNGLRVQLDCFPTADTREEWVIVSVGSVIFNSGGSFFGPPDGTFAKFELRESNGIIVPPKTGVVLEGRSPSRISANDLPRWPYGDRGLKNHLGFLTNGAPAQVRELKITDAYRVEKEGDYSLTVCAVIYQFEPKRDYLDRVDLPCVTTTIHLVPSP